MRILHFADVHLDRPFVGLAANVAVAKRADLVSAFRRCLALAKEREVDLVTIGGDLWEEEHVRADTRNSVAWELGQVGIPVLIACGNHDPLIPGGSYLRTEWPENVSLVNRGSITEHRYGDLSVWSTSWGGGEVSPRLLEQLHVPDDGRTHVLLIHGTSVAAPFADTAGEGYLPFDPKLVARARLAVCLAGHIHAASFAEGVVYPGSPEPLGWGEGGRHCAAFVDLAGANAQIDLVDVNEKRYEIREIPCSGCASSAEIDDRMRAALTDTDPQNVFLRVHLIGETGADCEIDRAKIVAKHAGTYASLIVVDETQPMLDAERRAERKGLDGLLTRKLLQRIESSSSERERRIAELALQAGLRVLDGRGAGLHVD